MLNNQNNSIIINEEDREKFINILEHANFAQTQETLMQKIVDNGVFAYIIPTGTFGFVPF